MSIPTLLQDLSSLKLLIYVDAVKPPFDIQNILILEIASTNNDQSLT